MGDVVIAPSILGVNINEAPRVIEELLSKGADIIHFDVMDGKFVTNKSFGVKDFNCLRERSNAIFDVHLMTKRVKEKVESYLRRGADIITFHYEAVKRKSIKEIIDKVHNYGRKAGISIKPNTDVRVLDEYLDELDLILIMTVEPGKGGQRFNEKMLDKIRYLDNLRKEKGYHYVIEVDGGINDVTSKAVREAGASYLVAGSYILKSEDRLKAIRSLKDE